MSRVPSLPETKELLYHVIASFERGGGGGGLRDLERKGYSSSFGGMLVGFEESTGAPNICPPSYNLRNLVLCESSGYSPR